MSCFVHVSWWEAVALPSKMSPSEEKSFREQIKGLASQVNVKSQPSNLVMLVATVVQGMSKVPRAFGL
jgi:hypothetical protein